MNPVDSDPLARIEKAIASLPRWRRWWAEKSFQKRRDGWLTILNAYSDVEMVVCGRFQTPTADWQPGLLVATDRSLLFFWFYLSAMDVQPEYVDTGTSAGDVAVPDLGTWETSYASITSVTAERGWFDATRILLQIGPTQRPVMAISPRSGAMPFYHLIRSHLTDQADKT